MILSSCEGTWKEASGHKETHGHDEHVFQRTGHRDISVCSLWGVVKLSPAAALC